MNRDELQELDLRAATEVMGWHDAWGSWRLAPSGVCEIARYSTGFGYIPEGQVLWAPTYRIEQAWELIEKRFFSKIPDGTVTEVTVSKCNGHEGVECRVSHDLKNFSAYAENASLAIVLVCLRFPEGK